MDIASVLLTGLIDLPWWGYILVTLVFTHITIASITIFLHRHQAHRALDLHPIPSHFFRFWLWLTTGMVTKEWAAVHRKHHAKCETVDDPHSPQIFGIRKVLGEGAELYKVTAVTADVRENSHLKFDMVLSQVPERGWVQAENGQPKSEAFWNPDTYLYVMFPEQYNISDFEPKYQSIFNTYFKPFGDQVGGVYNPPILQPLASIHFHSDLDADEPQGNIAYLYAFTGIGVFIILLACINYMNLSTARSVNRAGEIAMKKAFGSGKTALAFSFLGESIFLSFVALLLADIPPERLPVYVP